MLQEAKQPTIIHLIYCHENRLSDVRLYVEVLLSCLDIYFNRFIRRLCIRNVQNKW